MQTKIKEEQIRVGLAHILTSLRKKRKKLYNSSLPVQLSFLNQSSSFVSFISHIPSPPSMVNQWKVMASLVEGEFSYLLFYLGL